MKYNKTCLFIEKYIISIIKKNHITLKTRYLQTNAEGSHTKSTLSLKAHQKDNQATITCRAVNNLLPDAVMEATYKLHVLCKYN